MSFFPPSLENLIDCFAALPGIGRKSAQRLAFHVLAMPEGEAEGFAGAILSARSSVHTCPVCQNLTDSELCPSRATFCPLSEAASTMEFIMCCTGCYRP